MLHCRGITLGGAPLSATEANGGAGRRVSTRHILSLAAAAALSGFGLNAPAQGQIQRLLGVDVSDWQEQNAQGPINWTQLKNGGRDFAFIRSSRGGTTGFYDEHDSDNSNGLNTLSQRYDDYEFQYNITNGKNVGMYVGPYHFGRMDITTNTGVDEATHMIQQAGPWMKPGCRLPVFDLESGAGIRTPEQLAAFAVAFGQEIYNKKGV